MPDALYSDGSIGYLARAAQTGARAVIGAGLRARKDTFLPVLDARLAAGRADALRFSSREMVKMAMEHLHPFGRACFWDSETYNNKAPFWLLFGAGASGFALRSLIFHPFVVHPRDWDILPPRAADMGWLSMAFQRIDDFHFILDSDEFMGFSLTPDAHYAGTFVEDFPPNQSSIADVARWVCSNSDWLSMEYLKRTILCHVNDLDGGWKKVVWESDRVVNTVQEALFPWRKKSEIHLGAAAPAPAELPDPAADEQFWPALDALNAKIGEVADKGCATPEDRWELALLYERAGLYELGETCLRDAPGPMPGAGAVKAAALDKEKRKHEETLRGIFERNLAALKRAYPAAHAWVRERQLQDIHVAGSERGGYHLLRRARRTENGIERVAFVDISRMERKAAGLAEIFLRYLPAIQSVGSVMIADAWKSASARRLVLESHGSLGGERFLVYLAEPDPEIFAAMLHVHDAAELFAAKRVIPFVGPECDREMIQWLVSNPHAPLFEHYFQPEDASVPMGQVSTWMKQILLKETLNALKEIEDYYRKMPDGKYKRPATAEPAKILMFASRYHPAGLRVAERIASAFSERGHDVSMQLEPEDGYFHTVWTTLRAVRDFKPDFVIETDGHRYACESPFPKSVPYVSIVLDPQRMAGAPPDALGPRDFIFTTQMDALKRMGLPSENIHAFQEFGVNDSRACDALAGRILETVAAELTNNTVPCYHTSGFDA